MPKNEKLIEEIKKLIREEALGIPLYYRGSLAEIKIIDVKSFSEKLADKFGKKEN